MDTLKWFAILICGLLAIVLICFIVYTEANIAWEKEAIEKGYAEYFINKHRSYQKEWRWKEIEEVKKDGQ